MTGQALNKPQTKRPLFKTAAGASVLSKMLQGGTPEQIKDRMTEEEMRLVKEAARRGVQEKGEKP